MGYSVTPETAVSKSNRYNNRKSRDVNCTQSLTDLDYNISSNSSEVEVLKSELVKIINDFVNGLNIEDKTLFINKYFLFKSSTDLAKDFSLKETISM